jgi:cobalt-zinc-cadmium efflux system outer membrane protein
MTSLFARALGAALLSTLAACASTPRPSARDAADAAIGPRLGTPLPTDDAFVAAALASPLTPASASRIALARNPALAMRLAELGLARADLIEAAQIGNPTLSLSFLDVAGASGSEITRGLAAPLGDLLLRPARLRLGEADYAAARDEAAAAIIELALEVEDQWFASVAARQLADIHALQAELADAGAELAQRYADAGNLGADEVTAQRAHAAEAALAAMDARREADAAHRALRTALGLRADEAIDLPTRLPRVPGDQTLPAGLAARASAQRLDLAAAATQVERQRQALALARRWRLLGEIELGYERERDPDGGRKSGPHIALAIPIFNQGQAGIARAEASLALAEASLAARRTQLAQDVDDAREALLARRSAVDALLAGLLPARAARVERLQELQNWMLVGPFELIEARGEQFAAWATHVEAVGAYWRARIALRRAVGGPMPEWAAELPAALMLPPAALVGSAPSPPTHDHGDTP